jgi:hypothetical protein
MNNVAVWEIPVTLEEICTCLDSVKNLIKIVALTKRKTAFSTLEPKISRSAVFSFLLCTVIIFSTRFAKRLILILQLH